MKFFKNTINKVLLWLFAVVATTSIHASSSCEIAIKKGNYDLALPICLAESKRNDGSEIEAWFYLIEIHHYLGDDEQEAYFLGKVKSHPKFLERIDYQYQWYRRVGQKHYFVGDYIQAQQFLLKGLSIATQENNLIWQSKSFNDAGLVSYKLKDYANSLKYFNQSLALKLTTGDDFQIGNTLNNIALVHMDLEEPKSATAYYEQALEHYLLYAQQDEFDERIYLQIAHIYEDLTQAFTASHDVENAQDYAAKIIDTFKLKKSPKAQARALMNLAKHHLGLKQYASAQLYFVEAEKIFNAHQYDFAADYYLDAATVEMHQQNINQAIDLANQGLAMAESDNDHRLMSQLLALLSQVYEPTNPAKALSYMRKQQISREQFLQEKYDQDLNNVQHQIEKQEITHDLTNQQLLNANKSASLQRLTNGVLIGLIVLISLSASFIAYIFNKRRERKTLLLSIKHHEQQLFMMQNQQLIFKQPKAQQAFDEIKHVLKFCLVSTMIDALAIWEKATGTDRIELAEKSKVWTISIDNGTLRTRSLDKYLDIDKIPNNPRWRNVVKTCHYILSQAALSPEDRRLMEKKLADLLDLIKQHSLGVAA